MNDERKTLRRLEPSRNPPDGAERPRCERCGGKGRLALMMPYHPDDGPYMIECGDCSGSGYEPCTCRGEETCPQHTPPIRITDAPERD